MRIVQKKEKVLLLRTFDTINNMKVEKWPCFYLLAFYQHNPKSPDFFNELHTALQLCLCSLMIPESALVTCRAEYKAQLSACSWSI